MPQILLLILPILLFTSCAPDPEGYFKRSANNKLFDTQGFDAHKRRPLYNKKYIEQAKKNILDNNLADSEEGYDDDLSELEDTYRKNREMYLSMIESDIAKREKRELKNNGIFAKILPNKRPNERQPNERQVEHNIIALKHTSTKGTALSKKEQETKEELLKQINEIRSLLQEANLTIANIKQQKEKDGQSKLVSNEDESIKSNIGKAGKKPLMVSLEQPLPKNNPISNINNEQIKQDKVNKTSVKELEKPSINVASTSSYKDEAPKTSPSEIGFTEDELVLLREVHKPKISQAEQSLASNVQIVSESTQLMSNNINVEHPKHIHAENKAKSNTQLKADAKSKLAKVEQSIKKVKKLQKQTNQAESKQQKAIAIKLAKEKKEAARQAKIKAKEEQCLKLIAEKEAKKKAQIEHEKLAQERAMKKHLENLPWLDEDAVTLTPTSNDINVNKVKK